MFSFAVQPKAWDWSNEKKGFHVLTVVEKGDLICCKHADRVWGNGLADGIPDLDDLVSRSEEASALACKSNHEMEPLPNRDSEFT